MIARCVVRVSENYKSTVLPWLECFSDKLHNPQRIGKKTSLSKHEDLRKQSINTLIPTHGGFGYQSGCVLVPTHKGFGRQSVKGLVGGSGQEDNTLYINNLQTSHYFSEKK